MNYFVLYNLLFDAKIEILLAVTLKSSCMQPQARFRVFLITFIFFGSQWLSPLCFTGKGAAMVIESLGLYYHVECFRCCVCHSLLSNGQMGADVRVRVNRLHCKNCYSNDDGELIYLPMSLSHFTPGGVAYGMWHSSVYCKRLLLLFLLFTCAFPLTADRPHSCQLICFIFVTRFHNMLTCKFGHIWYLPTCPYLAIWPYLVFADFTIFGNCMFVIWWNDHIWQFDHIWCLPTWPY